MVVRAEVEAAVADFNSHGIDEKIERLSAAQADAVKKALDKIVPKLEGLGKTVDRKFVAMRDKMKEVGHQSTAFQDYFKRNYKKEDWKKLIDSFKE